MASASFLSSGYEKEAAPAYPELKPPPAPSPLACSAVPLNLRFDCHPDSEASEISCLKRGCCWDFIGRVHSGGGSSQFTGYNNESGRTELDIPYCFYSADYTGYKFYNVTQDEFEISGYLLREFASGYPGDLDVLRFVISFESCSRVRFKIKDVRSRRWRPPLPVLSDQAKRPCPIGERKYDVELVPNKGTFVVYRRDTRVALFDSRGAAPLVFSDQLLQLSTKLSSMLVYGLGQHLDGLVLDTYWKRHTLWNSDHIPAPGTNLYGSHPFYLVLEDDGFAHGVFLLNSNAMDVILQPTPALTYLITGGIIDLHIITGSSPMDVVMQYVELVGLPFLPPYWALGYHQCRFGYASLNRTRQILQQTRNAGIPVDVQWNDLDYMDARKDFTYDKAAFEGLPEFVDELHKDGLHYIPIIDPGISGSEPLGSYPPFDDGVKGRLLVLNSTRQLFFGKVWNPVSTVWPDFTHPKSVYYWAKQMLSFHHEVEYDGAWIDMNEPSNFYSGQKDGCPSSSLENPPFLPAVQGGKLFYKTMCMTNLHYIGQHYDVHNLYGFAETIATYVGLQVVHGHRPFIISRATFPGQGAFGGHWTGDIFSDWQNMHLSIGDILTMNILGIPMVGADICGFNGNTTVALCTRWMQLGAFYPFARNHNSDDTIDQDPVSLGPDVVASARKSFIQRYTLLPYLYTLFFIAHTSGRPVAQPLFLQYPGDKEAALMDTQFLWGAGVMIAPVLQQGETNVKVYLPKGRWFDWYTGSVIHNEGGVYVTLDAPLDTIPLLLTGGHILPCHTPASTTTESRRLPYGLQVTLDNAGNAQGEMFIDDGESVDTVTRKEYLHLKFAAAGNQLISAPATDYWFPANLTLGWVRICGLTDSVTRVLVNGCSVPFTLDSSKVLRASDLGVTLLGKVVISWL